jgi:hypothetical protein
MRALGYVRVSRVGKRKGDSFLSPEPDPARSAQLRVNHMANQR